MNENIIKNENENAAIPDAQFEVRPVVDITENADGVSLCFEVPGANSKTVDVEVRYGVLYVSAKSSLRRRERPIVYKRAFQLSDSVDVENISAKTEDGILTIVIPKSEKANVNKDSREQFEMRTHKRLIDILEASPKTVDALTHLDLPAGVDI